MTDEAKSIYEYLKKKYPYASNMTREQIAREMLVEPASVDRYLQVGSLKSRSIEDVAEYIVTVRQRG